MGYGLGGMVADPCLHHGIVRLEGLLDHAGLEQQSDEYGISLRIRLQTCDSRGNSKILAWYRHGITMESPWYWFWYSNSE